MFSLISKHKNIIIGVVVIVLLFLGYSVFFNNGSSPSSSSTLTRINTTSSGSADQTSAGREFVSQLLAIQNIHFNTSLFSDPAYSFLQDYSHDLTPQEVGRNNPFSPIGNDTGAAFSAIATGTGSFINTSATGDASAATSTPAPTKTTKTPVKSGAQTTNR